MSVSRPEAMGTSTAQPKSSSTTQEDRELARSDLGTGTIGVLNGCEFKFDLTLDEGESVYILEVGHRGEISYTWEEISKPEAVGLSLGDL